MACPEGLTGEQTEEFTRLTTLRLGLERELARLKEELLQAQVHGGGGGWGVRAARTPFVTALGLRGKGGVGDGRKGWTLSSLSYVSLIDVCSPLPQVCDLLIDWIVGLVITTALGIDGHRRVDLFLSSVPLNRRRAIRTRPPTGRSSSGWSPRRSPWACSSTLQRWVFRGSSARSTFYCIFP